MIVAVNSAQFDNGGHCGKWLTIQNNANGNTVAVSTTLPLLTLVAARPCASTRADGQAYAADECPTCSWGSLDLSPQAFGELNGWSEYTLCLDREERVLMVDYDEGMFDITWWWNE